MNKTDFDQGYDAGVLRALAVLDDAERELKSLDDDKSGFQRACYVRAICMAKSHIKRLMREQKIHSPLAQARDFASAAAVLRNRANETRSDGLQAQAMDLERIADYLSVAAVATLPATHTPAPIGGQILQTLCAQFSLEPYQVRAIEQAHGIT